MTELRILASRLCLAAVAFLAATTACGADQFGGAAPRPGFATVELPDQQQFRLRLDRDANVTPAQLPHQTLIVRRRTQEVFVPQSQKPLAEDWEEVGAAVVLPSDAAGGPLVARILWQDPRNRIQTDDRVELCRVPQDAARPQVLAVRCLTSRGVADAEGAVAVPGEEVILEASVFCPTADLPSCAWSTDVGEFLLAGGQAAGRTLRGPTTVRWVAPAELGRGRQPLEKATLRLEVSAASNGLVAEKALTLRLAEPKGAYEKVREVAPRTPLFTQPTHLAAGPLGTFFLLDAAKRVVYSAPYQSRQVPLSEAAQALVGFEGAAWVVQGNALLCWKPGAEAPENAGTLPDLGRLADLGFSAIGDLHVLDAAAVARVHVLTRTAGTWQEAKLEAPVAAPGLTCLCVDPLSNDLYAVDSQDAALRHWRARAAGNYQLVGSPVSLAKDVERCGAVVAILPRTCHEQSGAPPIHLVFQSGAVSENWTPEGAVPNWSPYVAPAPPVLALAKFAAQRAAALPDGDLLLAGRTGPGGQGGPMLAQVSPRGEFRRLLPLPALPPRAVGVAPGGQRYVLLSDRGREERIALLDSEGWMVRDAGPTRGGRSVTLRADRSSSDFVFLVGQGSRRTVAFRVDATNPMRTLELTSTSVPGQRIPDYEAVDVASSSEHLVILDRNGKVLVFANERILRYLGDFDTALRRPKAIAIFSNVTRRSAPEGDRHTYVGVLYANETASMHLWELKTPAGRPPVATALGAFPDPQRDPATTHLSSPAALDTGFPDHQETLFVLDRGGSQLRAFDVAEIAFQLSRQQAPDLSGAPLLSDLPFKGDSVHLAIGPGGSVHIADGQTDAIHTFLRRP